MEKRHRELLRKNRLALVQDLEPRVAVNFLFQEGIFSENDKDTVNSKKTRQDKAEKLLDILPRRGPKAFDAFYEALHSNETQRHLAFLLKCNTSIAETSQSASTEKSPQKTYPSQPSTKQPIGTKEQQTASSDASEQTEGSNLGAEITGRPPIHRITSADETKSVKESDRYPMNNTPHGWCLIVNNATFEAESGLNNRQGSSIDAKNLETLFLSLRYKVKLMKNLKARGLKDTVFKLAKENHQNHDSIIICLLSHGLEGKIYGVDGGLVLIQDLLSMFNGNNAKDLIGKPKLFFIQACRGGDFDGGIRLVEKVDGVEDVISPSVEKTVENILDEFYPDEEIDSGFINHTSLPSEADFVIAFSTVPGFVSWRHSEKGSWFIQALVEVFKEESRKEDVASMLIKINRKVALEYESSSRKKQMPAPVIMLTRKVFFFP